MAPRTLEASAKDFPKDVTAEGRDISKLFPRTEPKGNLEVYRILSPAHAGVRVSPLCLGTMSLGNQWPGYMHTNLSVETCEQMLDEFYEAGGNFIDTANNYHDEQSEMIIGEWMEKRQNRDEIVLATKYTGPYLARNAKGGGVDPYGDHGLPINTAGNHKKSLKHSFERSLQKLRTTYVDILYLHWMAWDSSVEEVMRALDDLVRAGKVLYLGISDTPAWWVAEANRYAKDHALTPFAIYQGYWNLASRDMERDIVPMCRAHGMAIAAYGVLGQGAIKPKSELGQKGRGEHHTSEATTKISETLDDLAQEIGNCTVTDLALAWVRQMYPYVFPVIGGSKIEHLRANIKALDITLTDEQMLKLDEAAKFNHGFPTGRFGRSGAILPGGKHNGWILASAGDIQYVKQPGWA